MLVLQAAILTSKTVSDPVRFLNRLLKGDRNIEYN